MTAKFGGMSDKAEIEVIEVEEGRLIHERNVAAKGRRIATGTYVLSDLPDGGTHVEFTFAFEQRPRLRAAARAAHAQDDPARQRARDDPPRRATAERGRRRVTDVEFLQWALPRVGLRWAGFRKVRRQVLRRVRRRLGIPGPERPRLLPRVSGGAPGRVGGVRGAHAGDDLALLPRPGGVRGARASGPPGAGLARAGVERGAARRARRRTRWRCSALDVLATDIDPTMLRRAREAVYEPSSLRELPAPLRERGLHGRASRCGRSIGSA